MSSYLKYAVLGAVVAFFLEGCDSESSVTEERPVAKIRHRMDAQRNRLWLLTGDGVSIYDVAVPDRVLRVPVPDWQFAGEPYGCLPDLALGPTGEAVISSDVMPALWRIDPETLAVTRHELRLDTDADKDVGFTALAYSPELDAFIAVSGLHGTVWRIDRHLRYANRMPRQVSRKQGCSARAPYEPRAEPPQ